MFLLYHGTDVKSHFPMLSYRVSFAQVEVLSVFLNRKRYNADKPNIVDFFLDGDLMGLDKPRRFFAISFATFCLLAHKSPSEKGFALRANKEGKTILTVLLSRKLYQLPLTVILLKR